MELTEFDIYTSIHEPVSARPKRTGEGAEEELGEEEELEEGEDDFEEELLDDEIEENEEEVGEY